MSVPRPSTLVLVSALAAGVALSGFGSGLARGAGTRPSVSANRSCYLVGQFVALHGAAFAANRAYVVSIDGVYFGLSQTDSRGGFSTSLRPGGLGAGQIQHVEHLEAGDGTSTAGTSFTVTRRAGGRFLAASGDPHTLRAPFEVWGFALDGRRRAVYLHYVSPAGHLRMTGTIGHTGGQCGFLQTPSRRVFPFSPSPGNWTLQLDTRRSYSSAPGGPVARIPVLVRGG